MTTDLDQEISRLNELMEKEEIKFVDFKVVDLFGRWRHLTIPRRNFNKEFIRRGVGFDGSSYGYKFVEKSDMLFVPQLSTGKREPLGTGEVLSVIGDIYQVSDEGKREPFAEDPRSTAKRAANYLEETGVADQFLLRPEFEFYLFSDASYYYGREEGGFKITSPEIPQRRALRKEDQSSPGGAHYLNGHQGYHGSRPGDSVMELRNEIVSYVEREGIEVKYHHHEIGGAGQSEIEVGPVDLVSSADDTMYLKHIVKVMGDEHGMSATFMPKPIGNFPGSGMHLHQQLTKDGKNLFSGQQYAGLSKLALFFIGGLLEHGRSLMGFTNPSTNSYRRMIPGHEAPTDLIFASSNRSAAIRIPGYISSDSELRIELRTMDGTCNPYLAYSAILMAGIDGVRNQIDPEKLGYGPVEENVYEMDQQKKESIKSTPTSLKGALTALKKDHHYLTEEEVFTEQQVEDWIALKENELKEFADRPHPYEHMLYYDV